MRCSEREDRWYIFDNHAEWRMCLVLVWRRQALVQCGGIVAFFPFSLTHCGVMSCVFALSVVGSCVTDFTTSHAWLKSKSHPHCITHISETPMMTCPKLNQRNQFLTRSASCLESWSIISVFVC